MNYLIKRKTWNTRIKRRLKYQEARKKELGKDLLRLSEILLILVVVCFAGTKIYYFLGHSPYFQLKTIYIEGLRTLPRQQVLNFSELYQKENIFKVNLRSLKTSLEAVPSIRQVRIYRRLPDSILIRVTERKPLGLINMKGHLYGLDEEGNLFKLALENAGIRLPVITGLENEIISGKIKNTARLDTALQFMKELLTVELPVAGQLLQINLTNPENIVLQTKDYGKISLGDINFEQLRRRLKKLSCVLEDVRQKAMAIEYIDMRFKNIVVKPR